MPPGHALVDVDESSCRSSLHVFVQEFGQSVDMVDDEAEEMEDLERQILAGLGYWVDREG